MSDSTTLAWVAFGAYLIITTLLALRGMQKTQSFAGFALGNRDMGPVLVGITLAASYFPARRAARLDPCATLQEI